MKSESKVARSYTREMAEFAAGFKLSDVPKEVIAQAKGVMLDGLGCGLFGSDVPWTQILAGVIKKLEPSGGQASVWGSRQTASAIHAALVNGTMAHAMDYDDAHQMGAGHISCPCAAAAMAVGSHLGSSDADTLAALDRKSTRLNSSHT